MLASRQKLIYHTGICKAKPEAIKRQESDDEHRKIIETLRLEVAELKTRLEEKVGTIIKLEAQVADFINKQQATVLTAITRPSTNVKNTIKNLQVNNLTPLLAEEMRSHIPMLTHEHIRAGAAGLAQYALEYPLKGKVMVADAARRKLKWKDEGGSIVEDLEGVELCKKFFEVHKEDSRRKISELMKEVTDRHSSAIDCEDEEDIKICDELICKLHDLRKNIVQMYKGEPNDLRSGFVKEICTKLGPEPLLGNE
jgi:hypothetical protein